MPFEDKEIVQLLKQQQEDSNPGLICHSTTESDAPNTIITSTTVPSIALFVRRHKLAGLFTLSD